MSIKNLTFHLGLVALGLAYYPLKRLIGDHPWIFVGICLCYVFALAILHAKMNKAGARSVGSQ